MSEIESKESSETTMKRQAGELMLRMAQLREATMQSVLHRLPDLELSPREMKVMMLVGSRGEIIMTELAAAIDTPLSTVTRVADRLERKGLIERSRSDRDRRIVIITASELGKSLHRAMMDLERAMASNMLELLTRGEREMFLEIMAKVADGLQRKSG